MKLEIVHEDDYEVTPLICSCGHPMRNRDLNKRRYNEKSKKIKQYNPEHMLYNCNGCRKRIASKRGYTCDTLCDYDFCEECVTCPQGHDFLISWRLPMTNTPLVCNYCRKDIDPNSWAIFKCVKCPDGCYKCKDCMPKCIK